MRKRVLIVEDRPRVRENLCQILEARGYEVQGAATAEAALDAIHRIAFHVVCIDLSLDDDDPTNTDGQKVLAEVARLAEGTRALIVSGMQYHHVTVEAFERYGLARYLLKGQFSNDDFAAAVGKEATAASLRVFGQIASSFDALLYQLDEPFWTDAALRAVHIKGGLYTLRTGIEGIINHLAPIRPHREGEERARVDPVNAMIVFRFWSKARGKPIRCAVQAPGGEILGGEERYSFGGAEAVVTVDPAGQRADYLD